MNCSFCSVFILVKNNFQVSNHFQCLSFFFLRLIATRKIGKKGYAACSIPVMIMLKSKSPRLPVSGETDSVNTASVDCVASKTVFSKFQVNVIKALACVGCQVSVVIVKVTGTVPLFLT